MADPTRGECLQRFANLRTYDAVAHLLETSKKQILYLLYGRAEHQRYTTFQIPKRRGGSRCIEAPQPDLKLLQRRFCDLLYCVYSPRNAVQGFAKDRSVATNARRHERRRYVFNVDLRDFFPSINFGRVRGLLMARPFNIPAKGATALAQLCCHRGSLPQGAPTSPVLSNMVCARMDRQLSELASSHRCGYTRYADDITFSKRSAGFPAEIGYLDDDGNAFAGEELRRIIETNDFRIHPDKVRLYTNRHHRQVVTGLTVNAKTNVPRTFVRQIRAMIHAWQRYGLARAEVEHAKRFYRRRAKKGDVPPLPKIIRGKLDYLKMVRGVASPVYRNLQSQFVRVDPEYLAVMLKENDQMASRDVFMSHASEDKDEIARPLTEALVAAGFTVWFDEYEIKIGDSIHGKIDEGLRNSQFGIVILSKNFFAKAKTWPQRELDGLIAKEDAQGRKRILPVWYKLGKREVVKHSPTLAGLKALLAEGKSVTEMVAELASVLRP